MLVEDQPAMRLVLVEVLTDLGHEVQAFDRGRPALEAMHAGVPPDLLITDVGLPGESTDISWQKRFKRLWPKRLFC